MFETGEAPHPIDLVDSARDAAAFERLFDASPVPMVITALMHDAVLAVNRRAVEVLGVPEQDAVGGRVTDYYATAADREQFISAVRRTGRADDVWLRLRRPDGTSVWAVTSARRISWNHEPAALCAFVDLTRQMAAEEALAASERRLAVQSHALTVLTEASAEHTRRFDDRLREILRVSAEALQADRVSLWRIDASHQEIRCESLFRRAADRYESGGGIARDACPAYFDALESQRIIAADDAHRDSRTRCFLESYLRPNGIGAMMDVPLRQGHGTLGVLCTEHVGGARVWTLDEQNFALSVANLITVALADDDLRTALARAAESEARARIIVDTAHDAFIGIDDAGRIVDWNEQAASTFGWTRADAIGRNLADTIIPASLRRAHVEGMRRFHETGNAPVVNTRLELTALHRSGREFPVELTITSPVPGEQGFFFGAFLRDISDRRKHDEQLRTAKSAAETSRDRLDRELASAGRMQQLLLPTSLPVHAGAEFVAHYRTSRHAGGDYYDVRQIDPHRFALVVADVSGHGASAAMVMAMIRAVLHAGDALDDPATVLRRLNDHFRYLWPTAMFATCIAAVLDVAGRTLRVASAGHPPPVLVRNGRARELAVVNAPLLFFDELRSIECLDEAVEGGDRIVFYTDGVTDRRAADDSIYDLPRVLGVLSRHGRRDVAAMVEQLVRDLDTFGNEIEPDDDQTMLAVGIR
jgi:PAS domain S-box-containing protein